MDASIPHQYCSYNNNYPFSAELLGLSTPVDGGDDAGKLNAIFNENGANVINNIVPSILNCDINPPVSAAVASSQFGVSDGNIVVPHEMSSGFDFGFSDNFAACDYNQLHQVFVKGEEYCSGLLAPNFFPAYNPIPKAENWGIIQGKLPATKVDDDAKEVKVGIKYSVEEKKDRILRYLKKRNQRNFNKTIKYACRKTLADKRVRIRGRFAKNNESCSEEETAMMNTSSDTCGYEENNNNSSLYDYNEEDSLILQMKYDEDYWLDQAVAMANLVQLPYLAS